MVKESACVLIFNEEGKILGVSRKDDPTAFGLPGGKLDPGETHEQAAVRECREETGLEVSNLRPVFRRLCEGEVDYNCVTFLAEYDKSNANPIALSDEETGVIQWIKWDDLFAGPFGHYNKQLFEKVQEQNVE
jgi:mutator protein MutT